MLNPNSLQDIPVDTAVAAGDNEDSQTETSSIRTSSTTSLSESVREYKELHGRTFSQKTEYWAPNDEREQDALDFNHYWMTDLLGQKLTLAPIGDNPQNVLDLGTGTGIWATDFADKYPTAEVIGIDISPIQPGWVPPNCKFQIDDFELDWTFSHQFDLIHIRNLEAGVSDWPRLYRQAFKATKPGSYIEVKQIDIEYHSQSVEVTEEHIFRRWYKAMTESTDKMGKTLKNVDNHGIAKGITEAGFVVEEEKVWKIPIGGWSKDPALKRLGACTLEYNDSMLESFALYLLKEVLGWEYTEIMVFVAEMRKELRNPKNQVFYHLHLVYGRKPEETEETAAGPSTNPVAPTAWS